MRVAILGVLVAYLVVGGAEVLLHWYAGTRDTPAAHSLKSWYLEHDDETTGHTIRGFSDLIFPAIALGLVVGWVTSRQLERVLVCSVFFLALGIVALMPLYAALLPVSDEWWNFASGGIRAVALVPAYFKAALLCLFFGAVGRRLAQSFSRRVPDDEKENVAA